MLENIFKYALTTGEYVTTLLRGPFSGSNLDIEKLIKLISSGKFIDAYLGIQLNQSHKVV